MSYSPDLLNWVSIFGQWLYDWQTLTSGMLALAAALWAGSLLRKQITQAQTQSKYERAQRFLALRCLLSIHLTEIVHYCKNVADELKPLQSLRTLNLNNAHNAIANLNFPAGTIEQFTKAIEFSDLKCFSKILAIIISELQVLNSRISDLQLGCGIPRENYPSNIELYLIQAAKIHSLCGSLYEYARQETDTVPNSVTWDGVQSALSIWCVDKQKFKQAFNYVERQKNQGMMFECM